MKTQAKVFIASILFLYSVSSCKKDLTKNAETSAAIAESAQTDEIASDCERKWVGAYVDGVHTSDTITKNKFIKNGSAKLPVIDWSNYFTGIYYDIPLCHNIGADSIRFEASIKNPKNQAGSIYDNDVILQIFGSKQYSEVVFEGSSASQSYDHILVGNYQISNLPELIHYFGNYETLSVELKNNTLSIFINGVFVKTVVYDVANKIGKLKRMSYAFKGTGSIDWVKLYSSNSNALIMAEEFNIDGQSSVVWY